MPFEHTSVKNFKTLDEISRVLDTPFDKQNVDDKVMHIPDAGKFDKVIS